jgi:hypothetical protein
MLDRFLRCVAGVIVLCTGTACADAHGFGHCGGFGCCRGYGWGWGYPVFGFGVGFGLGYGLGYGGGYPYYPYAYPYGYAGYGGAPYAYASPAYPYSAAYGGGVNGLPPVRPGYAPGQPQAPLRDDSTYPYNDPSSAPPLPAPAPRPLPSDINSDINSVGTAGTVAHERPRIAYPAYGEQPEDVTVISRSKRN